MMTGWFWIWLLMMVVFLLPPIGYGWGYRGWGPPYPRYAQRRRSQRADLNEQSLQINHQAWGIGGDIVWILFTVLMVWMFASLWFVP